MPFKDGFIEERLGALPSPWMPTHYRVPLATVEAVEQTPDEFVTLSHFVEEINDQGNTPACVGHCGDGAMSLMHNKDGVYEDFSAGWLYSRSRFWAVSYTHLTLPTILLV